MTVSVSIREAGQRFSGHGWVIPRADGAHARCGGPSVCGECQAEADELEEHNVEVVWTARLAPGMVTDDGREVRWVNGREVGFADGGIERDVTWLPVVAGSITSYPARARVALRAVKRAYGGYQKATEVQRQHWANTVEAMVEARSAGVSMARIGAEVGLTRERVRQIMNERDPAAVNGEAT